MTRHVYTAVSLAASTVLLSACIADDSLPTRPRTANVLDPSQNAQQNAEQRTMEKPTRELPTGGREFPGQSMAPATSDPSILTLSDKLAPAAKRCPMDSIAAICAYFDKYKIRDFSGPRGWKAFGHTVGPVTVYNRDHYRGPIPHLPENPGSIPLAGKTPAPDGDWTIDNSWGQGMVLENAPHRNWQPTTVTYKEAPVYHNPTYYFNVQEHMGVRQNPGTLKGDWISNAYEVPWFFLNTAILPLQMALEPPFAQRVTYRTTKDPNFLGHLPAGGDVVPAPYAGELKWTYPFLNPDGTVKRSEGTSRP